MTQKQVVTLVIILAVCLYALALAGYQSDDDILYMRFEDHTEWSEDSINWALSLPRGGPGMNWERGRVICSAYLEVDKGSAAAAIVYVNGDCFEVRQMFNINHLRRSTR